MIVSQFKYHWNWLVTGDAPHKGSITWTSFPCHDFITLLLFHVQEGEDCYPLTVVRVWDSVFHTYGWCHIVNTVSCTMCFRHAPTLWAGTLLWEIVEVSFFLPFLLICLVVRMPISASLVTLQVVSTVPLVMTKGVLWWWWFVSVSTINI